MITDVSVSIITFLFNIMMYALVPEYHDVIASAVATSSEIPVITPDMVKDNKDEKVKADEAFVKADTNDTEYSEYTVLKDSKVPLSESAKKKSGPIAIDKEYHEDCGTGRGYWVITYSDGSVVIE